MTESFPSAKEVHDTVHKSVAHSVINFIKTGEKQPGLPEHIYPILEKIRERMYDDGVDIQEADIEVTSITNALNIEINAESTKDSPSSKKLKEITHKVIDLLSTLPAAESYTLAMTTICHQITNDPAARNAMAKSIQLLFNMKSLPPNIVEALGQEGAEEMRESVQTALRKLSRMIIEADVEDDDE